MYRCPHLHPELQLPNSTFCSASLRRRTSTFTRGTRDTRVDDSIGETR